MKCVVCGGPVVLRDTSGPFRATDATFSVAMDGWICFRCQCEPLPTDETGDHEDTLPNNDPDWTKSK